MNPLCNRVSLAALLAATAIGPGSCTRIRICAARAEREPTRYCVCRYRCDRGRCDDHLLQPGRPDAGRGQAPAAGLASGIEITSEFRDTGSTAAFGQQSGGTGGDAGGWNFVPGAYLSLPLTDHLTFGLGINAPFGLKLVYEDGWVGRFQALHSEIETLNVNPSLAWQVNDRFSIGAGVNYQHLQAELTNAVNYSAVVAQGVQQLVALGRLPAAAAPGIIAANAGLEGDARVRGDDVGWGFNVGLLVDASDTTRIGLAYRSAIEYDVGGTVNFTTPASIPNPVGAGIVAAASATGAPLSSGPVSVDLKVPDSAILSLRQSVNPKLACWPTWRGPAGAACRNSASCATPARRYPSLRNAGATSCATPWARPTSSIARLTLSAGTAYDNTPVPDATRTPRLPDSDRIWVTTGAHWQPTDSALVDFGYAHLFSKTVPLNQNAGSTAASGMLVGEQASDIDIVSAQLIYRF